MNINLAGKTALVAGGNTGIGRAIALVLAQTGADVALTYLSNPGNQTVTAIRALGHKSLALRMDATDSAEVNRVEHVGHALTVVGDLQVDGITGHRTPSSAGVPDSTLSHPPAQIRVPYPDTASVIPPRRLSVTAPSRTAPSFVARQMLNYPRRW